MSYDFKLFKRKDGEDPLVTAQAVSEELPATPPDPQKEALKKRVANALMTHNPRLEVFQFDYAAIAKSQKISMEEARLKFRHIELNDPEDDSDGVQITLFDDEASVTVPYWHDGAKAVETFREIWESLEIISRETGYLIYDPQIDRVIEPSAGLEAAAANYARVTRQIQQTLPDSRMEAKPWWKFW